MTEHAQSEFDWVAARAKCSLASVFAQLQSDAEHDVEHRNKLAIGPAYFEVKAHPGIFNVIRFDQASNPRMVRFHLREDHIAIQENNGTHARTATVGLNQRGECVLRLGDNELFRWQLLLMVLEQLFFDPS